MKATIVQQVDGERHNESVPMTGGECQHCSRLAENQSNLLDRSMSRTAKALWQF